MDNAYLILRTLRRREQHELENFLLLPNIGHHERINLLAPFSNFPSLSASPWDHAEAVVLRTV